MLEEAHKRELSRQEKEARFDCAEEAALQRLESRRASQRERMKVRNWGDGCRHIAKLRAREQQQEQGM